MTAYKLVTVNRAAHTELLRALKDQGMAIGDLDTFDGAHPEGVILLRSCGVAVDPEAPKQHTIDLTLKIADLPVVQEALEQCGAEIARLKALIAYAIPVVDHCAVQFRMYEQIHLAKSTPDLDKAETNASMAQDTEAALAKLREYI